jgi:hypothetical protein
MSASALKWGFTVLAQERLSASERLVLLALCFHHHPQTGACFPSVETVSGYAGLSERPTQFAIRSLECRGLIKVLKRSIGGRQRANQYELFGARGAASDTPKPCKNRDARGVKKSTPQRTPRGVLPATPDRGDIPSRGAPNKFSITHPQFSNRGPRDA